MRGQRGVAASIEAAVILPGLVALVGLVVVLARIVLAEHDVQAVAANAARAASLARSTPEARTDALDAVRAGLGEHGLDCASLDVDVHTRWTGESPQASVEVRCAAPLRDVAVLPLPGTKMVHGLAVSPVDRHRGR